MKNILIIAPHADDEIIGCGGTIAKYVAQDKELYVAIITNGHMGVPELFSKEGTDKVRLEAKQSHKYLGIKETFFLDFPVLKLASEPSYKLSMAIGSIIKKLKIDTLFIPHRGDIHEDHRITFESALVAARPIDENTIKRIYAYETLSETEWAAPFADDAFIPNVFEDITNYIEIKKRAFKFLTTQIKEFPHPRSLKTLEALSNYRGATVGVNNAEAFMLIREINKK